MLLLGVGCLGGLVLLGCLFDSFVFLLVWFRYYIVGLVLLVVLCVSWFGLGCFLVLGLILVLNGWL